MLFFLSKKCDILVLLKNLTKFDLIWNQYLLRSIMLDIFILNSIHFIKLQFNLIYLTNIFLTIFDQQFEKIPLYLIGPSFNFYLDFCVYCQISLLNKDMTLFYYFKMFHDVFILFFTFSATLINLC